MIRINKRPTAILTSDWHLREDTPICRTDNYPEAQWKKVNEVSALQQKYDCPVIHAGDLFDHWKPSPFLLSEAIKHLPDQFYTIYGQHDLPQHNLSLAYKCGINTLETAKQLTVLPGVHWGQEPSGWREIKTIKSIQPPSPLPRHYPLTNETKIYNDILVWHVMTYQGKLPWPGCTDPMATKLLRKYPQFSLIVTGDNHKSFVEDYEGRLLVNPGSLMRMDADQVDHQPCVYLWYAENNFVKQIFLPIENNVISREHIEVKQQRDARIEAFVSRLDGKWNVALSFEENLEQFFKANNIRDSVKTIIYKAIEI